VVVQWAADEGVSPTQVLDEALALQKMSPAVARPSTEVAAFVEHLLAIPTWEERSRMAVAKGANPLTLAGLSGIGDLVLTCTGDLSRNRQVGIKLGEGMSIDEILGDMCMVSSTDLSSCVGEKAQRGRQESAISGPEICSW
jgi:hypothetical protein